MKPTKQQKDRQLRPFRFRYEGSQGWFYLCSSVASFHQVTKEGQHNVHGPSIARLIKALKQCGYIALLLFLSCGVVEAGEKHRPVYTWLAGDGCNTCEMDKYGSVSCTLLYCRGAWVDMGTLEFSPTCEKRMREVMKEADDFMQGRSGLAIYKDPSNGVGYTWKPHDDVKQRWDSVMKECIQ